MIKGNPMQYVILLYVTTPVVLTTCKKVTNLGNLDWVDKVKNPIHIKFQH